MTKQAKAGSVSFENALLDYVDELNTRMVEAGAADMDAGRLAAAVRATGSPLAEVAVTAAAGILDDLRQRLATLDSNINDGRAASVGAAMTARLPEIIAAVVRAQADPESADAFDHAVAERQRVQAEQADTLAQLEKAVEAGDVDSVMALRPQVEVALPSKLDAARLAEVDAQLALEQSTIGATERLRAEAEKRAEAAAERSEAARAALEEAQSSQRRAVVMQMHLGTAAAQHAHRRDQLAHDRAALATELDAGKQLRLRRLAGLDDTSANTPPPALTAPRLDERPIVRGGFASEPVTSGPVPERLDLVPSPWRPA